MKRARCCFVWLDSKLLFGAGMTWAEEDNISALSSLAVPASEGQQAITQAKKSRKRVALAIANADYLCGPKLDNSMHDS